MVAIVLFSTMAANASSSNNHTRTYTNEHPLIYEDCWDMYPYSFLNEQGKPDGYTGRVFIGIDAGSTTMKHTTSTGLSSSFSS